MKETPENTSEQSKELEGLKEYKEAGGLNDEGKEIQEPEVMQEEPVQEEQTQVPSEAPVISKPMLLGAGGAVLAFLAFLLFLKKRKKAGNTETSQPVKETTGIQTTENSIIQENVSLEKKGISVSVVHGQGAREDQQDSYGTSDAADEDLYKKKGFLAVVADGMGGLSNGGQVSSLIVNTCQGIFHRIPEYVSSADMLLEMAAQSNVQVNRLLQNGQKSGSTLVSAILRNGYLHFLTIGDSRIYLYRSGALLQLNREHIYKEELALMAVNGMIPSARISSDPQAKSLTSYFGNGRIAYLDRNLEGIRLLDKDRIILASDGIFGTLIPEQLEAALALPVDESEAKIQDMIVAAGKPYQDNYTAIILEYRE